MTKRENSKFSMKVVTVLLACPAFFFAFLVLVHFVQVATGKPIQGLSLIARGRSRRYQRKPTTYLPTSPAPSHLRGSASFGVIRG